MTRQQGLQGTSIIGMVGLAVALAVVVMVAGCASAPPVAEEKKMVWPPPPLTARIQFVQNIISEKDLTGGGQQAGEALAAFLTGEKMPSGRIAEPVALAVSDDAERLYVADMMQQAVFIFDLKNKKFTKLGNVGVPSGLALDGKENIYVVDSGRKSVNVFGRDGKQISEFSDPELERPNGIAIDRVRGKVYLVDTGSRGKDQNVKIYSLEGRRIGLIGGKAGADLGQFQYPTFAALDAQGNLYVSDTLNSRIQKFDPEGKFLTTFGQLGTNWGEFDKPKGVALDTFGNLYVADSGWSNIQIFNPKGQILLFFGGRGPVPGMMKNPLAVAIDKNNRIYVGDYLNHRIGVYQLVNTTAADSFLNPPPNPGPKK